MPLVKCPDCNKEISDKAPNCPGCGCPMKREGLQETVVRDKNAEGLMGKPGTGTHALNVGCLALILGIVFLFLLFKFI